MILPVAPSIDLARERSVGTILRATLGLYRDYPWLFLLLALAVIAPWDLLKLGVTGSGPFGPLRHTSFLARQPLDLLSISLIGPLVSALHIHAVVTIGKGQRPRLVAVARSGLGALPTVAIAALAAGVAIEIGLFALVIPGLVLWIRLSVVAQAAAIEGDGVRAALRRSWRLTRFHQGHVFGLLLVVGIMVGGPSLGALALSSDSGYSAGVVALEVAVNTVVASFAALTTALLYFDLRVRELHPRLPREHRYARDLDPIGDPSPPRAWSP